MSLDSIKTKTSPTAQPSSPKKIIFPVILIIIIIVAIWAISLKYNFSHLRKKSESKPSQSSQEVNSAIKKLSEELDRLKERKIFTQDASSTIEESVESVASSSSPSQNSVIPAQEY